MYIGHRDIETSNMYRMEEDDASVGFTERNQW